MDMNRMSAAGAGGPGLAISAGSIDTPGDWTVDIASLRRGGEQVQRVHPLLLTSKHEQWSRAVTQLQRLAQVRSAAQQHRETAASACRHGESIASRAKRCTGWGLSACAVGCLMLLVLASAADSEDGATADAAATGVGVGACLLMATALGLLCATGGLHARSRLLQRSAEQAAIRVEHVTRDFDEEQARVHAAEHELRLGYVRLALDEVLEPVALTELIEEYIEPPPGVPTDS